ncbi:hypothetical protein CERSUDRAFT_96449 [Gelatoporia subvermispora B]|uniref:RRM domain-containing protein n=1 Tax=Ceriporiopsis subvermispora (strain B) TaxID=914234 RepID=M2PH14_CERS8|nr:hypothetical protein CERSUDRAFT_96449 [Gelatoporia subvermispora B]
MTSQNPVFKFARESLTVKVDNLADSTTRQDIVELFSSLIGDVRKCDEIVEDGRRLIKVTFNTQDGAKKALCMSGYNVSGLPLAVTACAGSEVHKPSRQSKQSDARRNLYVLGLPFDLTKRVYLCVCVVGEALNEFFRSEFVEVFSRYGTVSHSVILATVDNASRRRGFVVMSTHEEARAAMDGLSRREIKGYSIDVSWAVVQRSQGFLDGGDRTSVLANQSPSPSPSPSPFGTLTPASSSGQVSLATTPIHEHPPPLFIPTKSTKLRVSNLPSVLFSQLSDLRPLFCPFGEIKNIEIVESDTNNHQGSISIVVEYASVTQAQEARDGLHGQMYSSTPVNVEFVQELIDPDREAMSMLPTGDNIKAGLNPHAAPFLVHAGLRPSTVLGPVTHLYSNSAVPQQGISPALHSGFLAVNPLDLAPYATHASLYAPLYVPLAGTVRPSSAPGT